MSDLFNFPHNNLKRRMLRNNSTAPEQRLWYYLRNKQFYGFKFRRQTGIGPYIADFYSYDLKLVIEVDGDSHGSNKAKIYDARRDEYMKKRDISILRFTNHEVMNNVEGVLNKLREFATTPGPSYEEGKCTTPGPSYEEGK